MPVTTVAELGELLRETNLLLPSQLPLVADLEAEFSDPHAAAAMLVRRKWLTPYQVEQVFSERPQENLVLGPYILLDRLGEGGMGQVYKARHHLLERIVALKVIREERLSKDPEAVRRFQREARAAALLSHPNIVLIYDADRANDTYYIAMEYIEGTDLARLVRETGRLPVDQACDFIRQAALGLQHAHEHGMVHRDIKPSNLLAAGLVLHRPAEAHGLSSIGSGPAVPGSRSRSRTSRDTDGPVKPVIKILDMGLVRRTQATDQSQSASLTEEGNIIGTPDYIAPEQARNAHRVDIRADLYSLGGTFYYLLTGQPPFAEGSPIEKLLMHQLDEPVPVAKLRPEVPAAVAAAVDQLMAKFPKDRYQTPAELADALAALDRAAPPPPPPPPVRKVDPHNTPTGLSSGMLPLPPKELLAPPTPRETVELSKPTAATLETGPESPTPEPRLLTSDAPKTIPDGTETPLSRQQAKHIAILTGHNGCVLSLAFTTNRDILASGGVDHSLRLWDFTGTKPRERAVVRKHLDTVNALTFTADNRTLASGSGGMDGLIWLWDIAAEQPRELTVLQGHKSPVHALAFSRDGRLLASGGSDATVRVWEVSGARSTAKTVLKGHGRPVSAVAFSPDGKLIASASQDCTVRLWDIGRLWSKERSILQHQADLNSVAFFPDGTLLATACHDNSVRLWDVSDSSHPLQKLVLRGHLAAVRLVHVALDLKSLVSVGEDRQVIVWEFPSGLKLREWSLQKCLNPVFALTIDGRYLANGTTDGSVNVYRVAEKRSHRSVKSV
jgi:serine/threonine-protein kinase